MIKPKELKALAKACRESGILEFKSPEFSFTLTEQAPAKQSTVKAYEAPTADVKADGWDTLSDMQKLFYSTGETNEALSENQQ